jgi:hypothetical protein
MFVNRGNGTAIKIAREVLKRSDHDARLVVAQKLGEKAIVDPDTGRLEFPAAFQESMRRGEIGTLVRAVRRFFIAYGKDRLFDA